MLLDFLKPTDPAITIHGSSAKFFPYCIVGDGDQELGFGVKDSLGVDGLDVRDGLGFFDCLNHR